MLDRNPEDRFLCVTALIISQGHCNIRSNVTTLRIVRWLLGYVGFVIPVHTACIKLVIRNLSSYYIGDED